MKKNTITGREFNIIKGLLGEGYTFRAIARKTGRSNGTIQKVKRCEDYGEYVLGPAKGKKTSSDLKEETNGEVLRRIMDALEKLARESFR
jgi:transposase